HGRWARLTGAVLMLAVAAGCSSTKHSPLVEVSAETAVALPPGFYPLKGHYDLANDDDHYNGWPRYIVSEADNMIMVYVPTQTIRMGGGPGPDEVPERTVTVNHFYVDLHEVSNLQFAHFWYGKKKAKSCPVLDLCGSACDPRGTCG